MTIKPHAKIEGLFIAEGKVFGRPIDAKGNSPADAFCEFIEAAKAAIINSSHTLREQAK